MPAIKVLRNGNITIPAPWRRLLGISEGDFVMAELRDNRIVLKPAKVVDAEDAWFHTKSWQKKEAEADRDIAKGKVAGPFSSVKELKKDLDS